MQWLAAFDGAIIARFVTSPNGIATVSLLILGAAAVLYWLGFRRRIAPLIRDLKSACTEVERTPTSEDFAANFHDIDERISSNGLLGDNWRQFQAALLWPEPDDAQRSMGTVQPPEYHFQRDTLLGHKLNLRLYNAVPNLLTGAGILGTFVGLVAGIYLASAGLASDEIAEAKQAMQTLLNGASLAFITSIVGLVSSIAFSIGEKRGVHRFDELLGRWIGALEKRLRRVTPEGLAQDQLVQTRQQTQVLEGFTDQLAFQIAEAFDQRLQAHVTDSIAPALEKLVDGIDALRADRHKTDEAVLEKLVNTFTGQLKGAAGTEMHSLAQTLKSLNDDLKAQTEDAEQRHRESQQASRESAEHLSELFNQGTTTFQEAVSDSVKKMSASVEAIVEKLTEQQQQATADNTLRLKGLSETFSKAVQGLDDTLTKMRDTATRNEAAATKVAELVAALDAAARDMQGLSGPIQSAASDFKSTGETLTSQVQTLQTAAETVNTATQQLQASNAQTRHAWQDYEARFQGIDEALGKAFGELADGVQAYTTQVNDLLGQLDQHTAEISKQLGGANQELGERIEELADVIGRVKRS
ncbi:MAG: anti-phage defense ZorAB system ZorA [Gammaproteobacteria bacterium]|jgi:predicted  nucleic acid-binding Zn-ribbon protein|nr:anti-phage defense ZorAB system ZorA [Gammaproteobacteria bacterium]